MKVGEYIRTPFGIRKIVDIKEDKGYKPRVKLLVLDRHLLVGVRLDYEFYTDERVIKKAKHSFNIIDLIKNEDYVNGEYVSYVNNKYDYLEVGDDNMIIYKNDIRSIITKEQISSMEYKI